MKTRGEDERRKPPITVVMNIREHQVLSRPPPGTIAVAGPFRPGTEDWMMFRCINDLKAARIGFVLVQERAKQNVGGYLGVSVWRNGVVPM